jgi:hypothetical protein
MEKKMADSHPYISGAGNISQMITHLRKAFPQTVTSETVKKLGVASKNESYVINALQFIGIIDDEGKKTTEGGGVFSHHKDEEFSKEFAKLVEKSYSTLFELHGDNAWQLEIDELITFFRQSDQTSDAIGKRQANTFKIFAAVSGHGEIPAKKASKSTNNSAKKAAPKIQKKAAKAKPQQVDLPGTDGKQKNIGLTVRIEINLPSDGTKETYDNIFKSIKENLIDG